MLMNRTTSPSMLFSPPVRVVICSVVACLIGTTPSRLHLSSPRHYLTLSLHFIRLQCFTIRGRISLRPLPYLPLTPFHPYPIWQPPRLLHPLHEAPHC